jgi:hypothetical protein
MKKYILKRLLFIYNEINLLIKNNNMENLEKDIQIVNSAIRDEFSLEKLLNLYKSNKYSPYSFSKKIVYIFMIIWIFLFILWLFNYSSIIIVIWFLIFSYFWYYLWNVKWYELWSSEWLSDWYNWWYKNHQLIVLKTLLEMKKDKFEAPEKATMNILMLYLSNMYSGYTDLLKDDNNKDMIEFELNKIISRENKYYYDMWFKK